MMKRELTLRNRSYAVDVPNELEPYIREAFKKNGHLYASKPKNASGDGKYVWRLLSFYFGTHPEMPVTADFDFDEYYWPSVRMPEETLRTRAKERREHAKELDKIVLQILDLFPVEVERGTMRWGRALGKL